MSEYHLIVSEELFFETEPTEPEETNPEPVTASLEDILYSLDISEAQAAEQKVIDEMFRDTLNSLDAIEWTNDIDELGDAETDELLRASEGEEEKEETMDEQPPNIIEAPFQCVDIRTKSEAARKASLKSIADRDAAKLARRRLAPRRPPVPAASCNRPTANYPPPVTADHMHMEGEARPPKIARLMSLTIHAPEETPPPYSPATTYYYAGNYDRPLPENRKRRYGNPARQPTSGCYRPSYQVGQGWDGLWFCQEQHCGAGHTSKSNRRCRKCCKRAYFFEKPVV